MTAVSPRAVRSYLERNQVVETEPGITIIRACHASTSGRTASGRVLMCHTKAWCDALSCPGAKHSIARGAEAGYRIQVVGCCTDDICHAGSNDQSNVSGWQQQDRGAETQLRPASRRRAGPDLSSACLPVRLVLPPRTTVVTRLCHFFPQLAAFRIAWTSMSQYSGRQQLANIVAWEYSSLYCGTVPDNWP